jgi:hypothetical protein
MDGDLFDLLVWLNWRLKMIKVINMYREGNKTVAVVGVDCNYSEGLEYGTREGMI